MKYRIITEKDEGIERYGIAASQDGITVKSIPDISSVKEDVENIVHMCNELEIELCHFEDVIEDYFTDFST